MLGSGAVLGQDGFSPRYRAQALRSSSAVRAKVSYFLAGVAQSSNWITPSSSKRWRSQPSLRVEQAELLAVRDDLREQHRLEHLARSGSA